MLQHIYVISTTCFYESSSSRTCERNIALDDENLRLRGKAKAKKVIDQEEQKERG